MNLVRVGCGSVVTVVSLAKLCWGTDIVSLACGRDDGTTLILVECGITVRPGASTELRLCGREGECNPGLGLIAGELPTLTVKVLFIRLLGKLLRLLGSLECWEPIVVSPLGGNVMMVGTE